MTRALVASLAVPLLAIGQAAVSAADQPDPGQRTSWLGETLLPEDAAYTDGSAWPGRRRWVQTRVEGVFVDPQTTDDTVYTNSVYDESGKEMGVYRFDPDHPVDGDRGAIRPVTQLYRQGAGGTAVAGDDKYLYADFTQGTTQVLVRFQRGVLHTEGSVKMAPFDGGDPVPSAVPAGRSSPASPAVSPQVSAWCS